MTKDGFGANLEQIYDMIACTNQTMNYTSVFNNTLLGFEDSIYIGTSATAESFSVSPVQNTTMQSYTLGYVCEIGDDSAEKPSYWTLTQSTMPEPDKSQFGD